MNNKTVGAETHRQKHIIFMQIVQIIKSGKAKMQFSEIEIFLYGWYSNN